MEVPLCLRLEDDSCLLEEVVVDAGREEFSLVVEVDFDEFTKTR